MDKFTMSMYWVLFGVIGWAIMFVYRIVTEGLPKKLTLKHYISGFVLACALGPFVFPTIGIILIKERYES